MLLRVISAEGELYRGDVQKVLLPTTTGVIGILPGHINIVTPLILGDISYLPVEHDTSALDSFTDHTHTIQIGGGIAMIENDIITVATE